MPGLKKILNEDLADFNEHIYSVNDKLGGGEI